MNGQGPYYSLMVPLVMIFGAGAILALIVGKFRK